jgi:hypothetical protein
MASPLLVNHRSMWQGDVDAAEARLRALAERDYTRSALKRMRAAK